MRAYLRRLAPSLLGILAPLAASAEPAALDLGRDVFLEIAQPGCAICHTLQDAEAVGGIGPNLDELKPSEDRVRLAVSGGVGAMPAYGGKLTPEQIDAVARYVATVTGAAEE